MNAGVEERVREEIAKICGHYLGAPAREEGARLVYVCPSCEGITFAANLVTWKAGCWSGRCPPGRYADALDLVSHFDGLSSLPEALGRAREILGLRVAEPQRPGGERQTQTGHDQGRKPRRRQPRTRGTRSRRDAAWAGGTGRRFVENGGRRGCPGLWQRRGRKVGQEVAV